jgi:integrase
MNRLLTSRPMTRTRYQDGWVEVRGKKVKKYYGHFYAYENHDGAEVRRHRCIVLGLKSQLDKGEAKEKLRSLIAHNEKTPDRKGDEVTFSWYLDNRYIPARRSQWRRNTVAYNELVFRFLKDRFGEIALRDMDRIEMQKFIDGMAPKKSGSLVKHFRAFLRAVLEEAVDDDYLRKNPARKLALPAGLKEPDQTILTWKQMQDVLASLNPLPERLIVELGAVCAPRPGELFAFRWSCFMTLENGRHILDVQETYSKGVLRPFAKTDESKNWIAVPLELGRKLEHWRSACADPSPEAFIFPNTIGTVWDPHNFESRVLRPIQKKLKLKKLNFQVMRRTFSTRASDDRRGTLKDIQRQLRHSKPDMTLGTYIKEVPESVFRMVDQVYLDIMKEQKATIN